MNLNYKNQNTEAVVSMFFILLGIILFTTLIVDIAKQEKLRALREMTYGICQKEIKSFKNQKNNATMTLLKKDPWGNNLFYEGISNKDVISHIIISAGQDGIFDTRDDIVVSDVDKNYSRKVGRWIGSATKRFTKGLKDGLIKKDRFSKAEEK